MKVEHILIQHCFSEASHILNQWFLSLFPHSWLISLISPQTQDESCLAVRTRWGNGWKQRPLGVSTKLWKNEYEDSRGWKFTVVLEICLIYHWLIWDILKGTKQIITDIHYILYIYIYEYLYLCLYISPVPLLTFVKCAQLHLYNSPELNRIKFILNTSEAHWICR